MGKERKEKRKWTAKDIVEDYRKRGFEISENDAEKLLDLLYFFAKLIVNQNFKK